MCSVHVRRQVVDADPVGDHHQLVAALRERPQLRHGRAEDRVLGVHTLGHEDQAHQRLSLRKRPVHERADARRVLGRGRVPLLVARERSLRRAARPAAGRRAPARARPRARRRLPGSTSSASRSSRATSGIPPTRLATIPRPRAIASTSTRPRPSEREGSTSTVERSICSDTPDGGSCSMCSTCSGSSATSSSTTSRRLPSPTITRRASGSSRTTAAPGGREPVDVLVGLEHADEERRRSLRQRDRRRRGEGRQIHVGLEGGGRGSPAHFLDQTLGVARERTHGVGAAERGAPDDVGERREEPPRRRAVQPRRGPPVAVHLEHDLRPAPARKRPAHERRRGGVGVLRDDRLGPEVDDLPAHVEGQAEVEEGAVEQSDPARSEQAEAVVGGGAARIGRGDDAKVELALERIELPGEPVRKRQAVPQPADHQDARALALRHRARHRRPPASSSSSIRP